MAQRGRVDAHDLAAELLQVQRDPPAPAAQVRGTATHEVHGFLFGRRPLVGLHQIDLGTCAYLDDAVVALDDLGRRATAHPIEEGLTKGVGRFPSSHTFDTIARASTQRRDAALALHVADATRLAVREREREDEDSAARTGADTNSDRQRASGVVGHDDVRPGVTQDDWLAKKLVPSMVSTLVRPATA